MSGHFEFDYFFWVVAVGTMILGASAAIVGSTLVLEKQSQLGDAIGHAVYPGVVLAFIIFQTRLPIVLLFGAIFAGLMAFFVIRWIRKHSDFHYEAVLALVLSAFFGIGMVLSSYIQGNPNFQKAAQAGLKQYIMGQAAYLVMDDIWLIASVSIICLGIFFVLYPKIKLVLFDKVYANAIGLPARRISNTCLLLCLLMICIGLKVVGAILISSMLVAPTVAALQWTRNYRHVLWIAAFIGIASAFLGTYLSTAIPKLATGPTIVLCLSAFALLSILLSPNGVLITNFRRLTRSTRQEVA